MNRTVFEDRLRRELAGNQWSQPQFARMMEVSQQTVTAWVTGKWEPRMKQLAEMASLLNVSMEYLSGVIDERVTISDIVAEADRKARNRAVKARGSSESES